MSFLGGLVGAVGSLFGAHKTNSAAADMQQSQIAANKETMQNKHQWEVADLRNAGLNPMLSAMNSATGTLSAGLPSAANMDLGGAISSGISASAQKKQADLQEKMLDSNIEKNQAESTKALAEAKATSDMIDITRQNSAFQNAYTSGLTSSVQIQNSIASINMKYHEDLVKAGLTEQKIKNLYAPYVYEAQLDLWSKQGNAALTNADANMIKAQTADKLSMSQEQLNYALSEKGRSESRKNAAELDSIISKNKVYDFEHDLKLNKPDTLRNLSFGRQVVEEMPLVGNVLKFFK